MELEELYDRFMEIREKALLQVSAEKTHGSPEKTADEDPSDLNVTSLSQDSVGLLH
jgi:hypothetical protein